MRVEESSQVACFILCRFFLQRGGFLHSADAPVGMTSLGGSVHTRRLFLQRPPERHAGRSLRFRWEVDSFSHTGCVRNVVWRWIIAATLRNTIQPYRLYSECGVVPFWAVFFLHIHFTVLLPFRGFRLYMGAV